ncbi:hypothetical protein D3C71_2031200 [compost metagenome]
MGWGHLRIIDLVKIDFELRVLQQAFDAVDYFIRFIGRVAQEHVKSLRRCVGFIEGFDQLG